jgi:hypothetical protein
MTKHPRPQRSTLLNPAVTVCLILVCLVVSWVLFNRILAKQVASISILAVYIPDDYYGKVQLVPADPTSPPRPGGPVIVDSSGRGILPDPTIVNRGFQLDMRRNNGTPVPLVLDKSDLSRISSDVVYFDDGSDPGAALVLYVAKQPKPE